MRCRRTIGPQWRDPARARHWPRLAGRAFPPATWDRAESHPLHPGCRLRPNLSTGRRGSGGAAVALSRLPSGADFFGRHAGPGGVTFFVEDAAWGQPFHVGRSECLLSAPLADSSSLDTRAASRASARSAAYWRVPRARRRRSPFTDACVPRRPWNSDGARPSWDPPRSAEGTGLAAELLRGSVASPTGLTVLHERPRVLTNRRECPLDRTALQDGPPVCGRIITNPDRVGRLFSRARRFRRLPRPADGCQFPRLCGDRQKTAARRASNPPAVQPGHQVKWIAAVRAGHHRNHDFGGKNGPISASGGRRGFDAQHAPARKTANAPTLQLRSQPQQTRTIRAGDVRRVGFLGPHVGIPPGIREHVRQSRIGLESNQGISPK